MPDGTRANIITFYNHVFVPAVKPIVEIPVDIMTDFESEQPLFVFSVCCLCYLFIPL